MSQWKLHSLGDVFDIARGGSPRPIQDYLTDSPDGINWIMIGDTIEGSKYITKTKNKIRREGLKKTREVHSGDFLLTNSMSFGRPYILKTSGCVHDGWLVLSSKSKDVHPDFFYYLLASNELKREFSRRAAGAVVKNLNTNLVKSVQIPLPPLSEQKRIAAILDAADALREKRKKTIAKLDELIQSTFLEMFGDPVTNPKGWEVACLPDVCRPKQWPTIPKVDLVPSGYPVYGANGKIGFYSKFTHSKRTVLITCRGATCGTINVCESNSYVTGNAMALDKLQSTKINLEYLSNFLKLVDFSEVITGVAQPQITRQSLSRLRVLLPPIELQNKFKSSIVEIQGIRDSLQWQFKQLDLLFASLQSRAFKGEL